MTIGYHYNSITCSLRRACGIMMSKYAIQGHGLPHSFTNVTAQQFRWLHRFSFCLNIKSWRTTITPDSSIIILHLLHKSKWGGKALAGCLKLLAELMCQLQFFAVVTRSKKSKNQARGGCFLFLEQLVTQLFYRCIFENLVVWLASLECLLDPRQNQPRVTDRQIVYIPLVKTTSILSIQSSVALSRCSREECFTFWYVVGHLHLLSPLLSPSVPQLQQHNRPWTAVSSHWVLLGALISDWHVVIALPDHS